MGNKYKREMAFYKRQMNLKKRIGYILISATTVFLAAAILTTAIGGGVIWISGLDFSDTDKDGDPTGDTAKPVIKAVDDETVIYTGSTVRYKELVTVSDDSGSYELTYDESGVDQNKVGEYQVIYTATDAAGNKTVFKLKVYVKDGTYTEEKLMTLIASKAKSGLGYTKEEAKSRGLTKTQIAKDIYNYVNDPTAGKYDARIYFNDISNTPAQQKQGGFQSRTGWKTDWIEEAYRTLSMSRMEGDCYSYYAVSKAFFEYFGIENCGVQRNTTASELKGTHYWNIVKVEGGWYYFDATRLGGSFSDGTKNACLITESKLQSYETSDGSPYFYKMNKTDSNYFEASANGGKLPTIATK